MIIAMVRHGQTDYNANGIVQGRVNIPLNEVGKKQSIELANIFSKQQNKFDVIVSSPLSRALETAYIISKKLGYTQPIRVEHQFVERDFFHLDELPVGDAMPLVRQKNYTYEGYENDQLLINRVVKATLKLAKIYTDKQILLITHSHVIKALRVYVDPTKYAFTDIVNNTDIIYFEINKNLINISK
ncbi:MAG: phosphoglycerate mutase family protein [Acholeplasmataceae bacterium]|nr:phosphoglycerate mutase family protein [Acholeplasmataceae bacterium]